METKTVSRRSIKSASAVKAAVALAKEVGKPKPSKISHLLKKTNPKQELKVTFGNDPEMFCQRVADGKIVSSIPVLKQDKHNPIDLGDGIKGYADNALVECSFPPYTNLDEMLKRFKTVFTRLQETLGADYRLLPQASYIFPNEELVAEHGIDPWEIGCSPSIDAHLESVELPTPFADGLRSGSCHFHIGNADFKGDNNGKFLKFDSRNQTVKLMDIFVGLSSVIFDRDPTSLARRKHYGRASNMRTTMFGLEYRVLGNYCLRSPELMTLVYDLINHVLGHVRTNKELEVIESVDFEKVRDAINTCNVDLAHSILSKTDIPAELLARVKADYGDKTLNEAWGI